MTYETLYFDTTRTMLRKDCLNRLIYRAGWQLVQLLYQQLNPSHKVTLMSVCTSNVQWMLRDCYGQTSFVNDDDVKVFGVIVLNVSRHSIVVSPQTNEQKVTLIIGHDNWPFCIFHRSSDDIESLTEPYPSYSERIGWRLPADWAAHEIDSNIVFSAMFRRQIKQFLLGDTPIPMPYTLTSSIHNANEVTEWVYMFLRRLFLALKVYNSFINHGTFRAFMSTI